MRRATHSYTFSKTFHNISIHALHEESDDNTPSNDSFNDVISIHALHEESDWREHPKLGALYISIHALHEESDRIRYGQHNQQVRFQSTLSMRRATIHWQGDNLYLHISIHALHEESDSLRPSKTVRR